MNHRSILALAFGLSVVPAAMGCKHEPTASTASRDALPPLAAEATTKLAVSGLGDAVVAVPVGATRPLPVVVAVLGIGDTPEGQCASWRDIVDGRAFVLCPRGQPNVIQQEGAQRDEGEPQTSRAAKDEVTERSAAAASAPKVSGFYPPDRAQLEREVDADLAALRARFGRHVADGPVVYAGFSRGAFLGASLVGARPDRYPRAVFIEGGQTAWTADAARAFASGGGKRVLFACGQSSCIEESNAAAKLLEAEGVATRVVHGEDEGHGYSKQVKEEVRRAFDWAVEGDARFRPQLVATR